MHESYSDYEETGELIKIEGKDGIVRMDHDNKRVRFSRQFLGKIYEEKEIPDKENEVTPEANM